MKYFNKLFLLGAGLMLPVFGCDTQELTDMNVNPQAVTQIDMNYLFTSAQLSIASNGSAGDNRYTDWRTNIGFCGGIVQQLTTFGSISGNGNYWNHNEETVQCIFEFSYNDQLKNLAEVLKQTGPGGYEEGRRMNTRQAARVLKAWTIARLTDFYGPVPYFEANQGIEGIFFPHYDNQSVIYAEILRELDEAAAGLSASNPDDGFIRADMIYQGDVAKWKRWAYSLMLRYAMRASNVDAAMANTYVAKAVAGGVFTSNADNVNIKMSVGPSEWTNQNGISRAFFPGDGGNQATLGEPFVNFLKGTNQNSAADDDPRLFVVSGGLAEWTAASWNPYPNGLDPLAQKGVEPGYYQSEVAVREGLPSNFLEYQYFSRINYLMLQDDDPYMIMNHAEAEFLLAEACERSIGGLTPAGAAAHYDAGVKSAMQMYDIYDPSLVISDAQVNAYLALYPYGGGGVGGGKSNIAMIADQLWVSHFLNWYDAWSDYRRMDLPALVQFTSNQSTVTASQTISPVRLRYPNIEVVSNINFDQGAKNNYVTKVWWDGGAE